MNSNFTFEWFSYNGRSDQFPEYFPFLITAAFSMLRAKTIFFLKKNVSSSLTSKPHIDRNKKWINTRDTD